MNTKWFLVGLLWAILAGSASIANSQCWGGYFPYAPACWNSGYSNSYVSESVPYFALHPPVYYSYRVARTYGFSPFAYPPCLSIIAAEPIRNAGRQNTYPTAQKPEPLMVVNPFVEQSDDSDVTKPTDRRPQVVYPASLAKQGS